MNERSEPDRDQGRLPFRAWWPFAAGVVAGLALRVAFSGRPGGAYQVMEASFVYLCPVVIGAVTVYVAERRQRRSWAYYFWAPLLANVLFVVGTMLALIEGLICAVVVVPLFAVIGGLAGLIMGAVCRVTKWPKQVLMSIGVLPLVLGGLEAKLTAPVRIGTVDRSVLVDAAPEVIWRQIHHAENIQPGELNHAWIFRIG